MMWVRSRDRTIVVTFTAWRAEVTRTGLGRAMVALQDLHDAHASRHQLVMFLWSLAEQRLMGRWYFRTWKAKLMNKKLIQPPQVKEIVKEVEVEVIKEVPIETHSAQEYTIF